MKNRLDAITLKGFKTIRELDNFRPGPLTVLIGPNGVGKSNFISFFRMLSWMLVEPDHLQTHVAEQGGASKLLHDGPAVTREIEATLTIQTDVGENQYHFRLFYAAGDTLIFADERYRFSRKGSPRREASLANNRGRTPRAAAPCPCRYNDTARVILSILRRFNVYQFHNTSTTPASAPKWIMNDNRFLGRRRQYRSAAATA